MSAAIRHLAILGSGKLLRVFSNLLLTGLMARTLGPEGVGQWAMVIGAATLLNSGLIAWTQDASIRFGRDEWRRDSRLSRTWASRWPFVIFGFFVVFVLVLTNPADWMGRLFHLTPGNEAMLLLAVVGLWLAAEGATLFQVRGDIWSLSYWTVVADIAAIAALMVLVLFGMISAWGIPALLLSVAVIWWVGCGRSWRSAYPGLPRPDRESALRTWRFASPLIPGFVIGYVSAWTGQLLLSRFSGLAEVGIYQMSYQVLIMLMGLGGAIGTVAFPRLIDRGNDPSFMREFVSRYVPTLLCLWGLAILPIVAATPPLLPLLLGPQFERAADLIAILVIGVPGSVITFLYGALFSLQGRLFRSTVVLAGTVSCFCLGLSFILVPGWGGHGAAIALSGSYLLAQTLYVLDQHRYLRSSVSPVFLLIGTMLPFSILQSFVPTELWLRVVFACGGVFLLIWVARSRRLIDVDVFRGMFGGLPGSRILARLLGLM